MDRLPAQTFPPAARLNTSNDAHDGDAYHFPGLVFREADREVAVADGHEEDEHREAEAERHEGEEGHEGDEGDEAREHAREEQEDEAPEDEEHPASESE